MKTSRIALALILFVTVVTAVVLTWTLVRSSDVESQRPDATVAAAPDDSLPAQPVSEVEPLPAPRAAPMGVPVVSESPVEKVALATNKLDRLAQIRETFRKLAAGDKTNALHAAKQIVDETERETALLTLVTEWTQGELSPPRLRAERIAGLGLEAGLGIELGRQPELALLWANEMTEGPGRAAVLQEAARFMIDTDPAAAFALTQQLPEADRRGFSDDLFANWAGQDTEAALQWAGQFSDTAEREAAVQAIRSAAPVGIGAALAIQDGYPVIKDLVPGTPAERSGQLQVGDRIVALAQGDGAFVDLHEVGLQDIVQNVRGLPNSWLQLKVVPAGAAPNTPPKTVLIVRDQIKFKK